MNIFDAVLEHAQLQPTQYFLRGRTAYADEIFCPEGFLPLIGRMAECRLGRVLSDQEGFYPLVGGVSGCASCGMPHESAAIDAPGQTCPHCGFVARPVTDCCGFSYIPLRESIFKERIQALPAGAGVAEDSLRLAALLQSCRDVVGLGLDATLDLTPVYDFFAAMQHDQRELLRTDERASWPLYQAIRVS